MTTPTPTITLRPVSSIPRSDFIQGFNAAYADYLSPIHLTDKAFENIVARESIRLESSVAAMTGRRVVGTGMLGVRGRRAWIGGMGVIPEFRRQGVGRRMMNHLIEQARTLGVEEVILEVITSNDRAFSLYQSLGFQTRRRLLVLNCDLASRQPLGEAPPAGLRVGPGSPAELLRRLPELPAPDPPWQRDPESALQIIDRVDALSATGGAEHMEGICLWSGDENRAGIIALAAATPQAGRALLARMFTLLPDATFFYLNVPEDDPHVPALRDAGFNETLSQFEMTLGL